MSSQELAQIFKGTTQIDFAELKDSIFYTGFLPNDEVLEWFWRYIEDGGSERGMQLIHFVTGLNSLPVGGLSEIPRRISIEK